MKLTVILILAIAFPVLGNAQCKGFTKKECRPKLDAYTHDGKMNFAVMYPGDDAELAMTFYANQDYRLAVCAETFDSSLTYKVLSMDRKELYSSQPGSVTPFDFSVSATQQLIVQIKISEFESTKHTMYELDHNGCVSILVGLKEE